MDISKINVSLFDSIFSTESPKHVPLTSVVDMIRNGAHKAEINRIRKAEPTARSDLKKKLLPVFCCSGTFTSRNDASLIKLNQVLCLDLDHVKEKEAIQTELSKLPYVVCIFKSPSDGLKVIVYHDCSDAKYYSLVYRQFGTDMGLMDREDLEFDVSCSNISRACFLSYDPGLFFNASPEPYHIEVEKLVVTPTKTGKTIETSITTEDDELLFPEALSNYRQIRKKIQENHTLFEDYYSMFPSVRNNHLNILARFFRIDGIPEEIAENYLVAYYADPKNDFYEDEIRKTVRSAYG